MRTVMFWASSVSFSTSQTSRQMSHWDVHCEQISRHWTIWRIMACYANCSQLINRVTERRQPSLMYSLMAVDDGNMARLVSSFRQCWPRHLASATADVIRPRGCSGWLVYIISARTHAEGSLLFIQIGTVSVALRRATRIGPRATRIGPGADSVLTVYRRSFAATSTSSDNTSQLYRRHADDVLSSLRDRRTLQPRVSKNRWGRSLVTSKSTATQPFQDWGAVVHITTASASAANCRVSCWQTVSSASQSDRFATSALISTLTWECGRTSCQPPLSARFVASDVHCQDMPCSHWYTHSWWARWTTATRSLPEWPEIFSIGCSPFWTPPPLDSCFRRGNSTESRRCFANCTEGSGWRDALFCSLRSRPRCYVQNDCIRSLQGKNYALFIMYRIYFVIVKSVTQWGDEPMISLSNANYSIGIDPWASPC